MWNFTADVGLGATFSNNVNSVSKTRLKYDSNSITEFTYPFDRTESASIGITATRPVGEESSLLLNFGHTTSNQYQADDDFQSYGLTIGLDTTLGNPSYIIIVKLMHSMMQSFINARNWRFF